MPAAAPVRLADAGLADAGAALRSQGGAVPGAAFVVGVDTAERLVAQAYYGGSEEQMRQALGAIGAAGCRFLVAGRLGKDGTFQSLRHVGIPAEHRDLFCDIPETDFRLDISSTVLRATV